MRRTLALPFFLVVAQMCWRGARKRGQTAAGTTCHLWRESLFNRAAFVLEPPFRLRLRHPIPPPRPPSPRVVFIMVSKTTHGWIAILKVDIAVLASKLLGWCAWVVGWGSGQCEAERERDVARGRGHCLALSPLLSSPLLVFDPPGQKKAKKKPGQARRASQPP